MELFTLFFLVVQTLIYSSFYSPKIFVMKKTKWIILSMAIVMAISTAFITRPCQSCMGVPLYYLDGGGGYSPAGTFGVNYYCVSGDVCTYYLNNNVYTPCQSGGYTPIIQAKQMKK
jgi:hypothetical protein